MKKLFRIVGIVLCLGLMVGSGVCFGGAGLMVAAQRNSETPIGLIMIFVGLILIAISIAIMKKVFSSNPDE